MAITRRGFLGGATLAPSLFANSPNTPLKINTTLVDDQAIGYATFQSHNQKQVANQHGLFMSHLRSRNEAYTAQTWRLSRSVDHGKTWTSVFEDTHATNPPCLETDSAGNVYLVRMNFLDNSAALYRFLAKNEFKNPEITQIPGAAAGKYAACIDQARAQLYLFSHNNSFHVIGSDGKLRSSIEICKGGTDAILQYPHLFLDDKGQIHAAWTTQKHNVYLYWDIHHMVSPNGGKSWMTMSGDPISLPVIADQHGPSTRITLEDEFEVHTWLSSMTVQAGKLHFVYQAQSPLNRQHYVRYDLASGKREIDRFPQFKGETFSHAGLDGSFVGPKTGKQGPLYFVGNQSGQLIVLRSADQGSTWQDFAQSEKRYNLYSIGTSRTLTEDGSILGAFVDQAGSNLNTDRTSKVYAFRIPSS